MNEEKRRGKDDEMTGRNNHYAISKKNALLIINLYEVKIKFFFQIDAIKDIK